MSETLSQKIEALPESQTTFLYHGSSGDRERTVADFIASLIGPGAFSEKVDVSDRDNVRQALTTIKTTLGEEEIPWVHTGEPHTLGSVLDGAIRRL